MATGNIKLEIDPESYEKAKAQLGALLQTAKEINSLIEVLKWKDKAMRWRFMALGELFIIAYLLLLALIYAFMK